MIFAGFLSAVATILRIYSVPRCGEHAQHRAVGWFSHSLLIIYLKEDGLKIKTLAVITMMGLGALSASVQAAELPNAPHVITSGQSSIEATPDIASLIIEVNVVAKDAPAAKQQSDQRVAQYIDFLQKNGVVKKDIDAANLLTRPEYEHTKDGKAVLKGYRANRQVKVTLRQLDKLNDLLDGALKAGLNEIRSVELGIANPEASKDLARKAAMDDAVRQAGILAAGFNTRLGPVYSIRYHVSDSRPAPMARMYQVADSAQRVSAAQTYSQESIRFEDQVDVVFELERN